MIPYAAIFLALGFVMGVVWSFWLHTSPARCARIIWDMTRWIANDYAQYLTRDASIHEDDRRLRIKAIEMMDTFLLSCMNLKQIRREPEDR